MASTAGGKQCPNAFTATYGDLRALFRTPVFAREWEQFADTATRGMAIVDQACQESTVDLHSLLLPTLVTVTHGGAALGHIDLTPAVTKADGSAERQPRRRYLDRKAPVARPRLYGLRPMPVPAPPHTAAYAPHTRAAEALSLDLVTRINRSQRAAIHGIVVESFRRGIAAKDTANRIANVVGLFPRWQRAVNNLHASMLANDVPARIADRRARAYSDELIQKRAVMIARTELLRAMNTGRWLGWHDLADQGIIDPERSTKEWTGSIDSAICPECEYLADPNGDGVGVIVTGIDTLFHTEYGDIRMPPAHPHCRCGAVIHPYLVLIPGGRVDDDFDVSALDDPEVSALAQIVA